jgi:hypothetical protein
VVTDRNPLPEWSEVIAAKDAEVGRLEAEARLQYQEGFHDGEAQGSKTKREYLEKLDATITRLTADNERLRAALADLVRLVDQDDDYEADDVTPYHADVIMDRARAALTQEPRT